MKVGLIFLSWSYRSSYQTPRPLPCCVRTPRSTRFRKCTFKVLLLTPVKLIALPIVMRPCSRTNSTICNESAGKEVMTRTSLVLLSSQGGGPDRPANEEKIPATVASWGYWSGLTPESAVKPGSRPRCWVQWRFPENCMVGKRIPDWSNSKVVKTRMSRPFPSWNGWISRKTTTKIAIIKSGCSVFCSRSSFTQKKWSYKRGHVRPIPSGDENNLLVAMSFLRIWSCFRIRTKSYDKRFNAIVRYFSIMRYILMAFAETSVPLVRC